MLESKYVPKLYNVCFDPERIYMIQQKAGKRTLKAFLKKYHQQITVIYFYFKLIKKILFFKFKDPLY